jgi:hypothetical protein
MEQLHLYLLVGYVVGLFTLRKYTSLIKQWDSALHAAIVLSARVLHQVHGF